MIFKDFLTQNSERAWPLLADRDWAGVATFPEAERPTHKILDFGAVIGPLGTLDWTDTIKLSRMRVDAVYQTISIGLSIGGREIASIESQAQWGVPQTVLWTHVDGPQYGHGFIVIVGQQLPLTYDMLVDANNPAPEFEWATVTNRTGQGVRGVRVFNTQAPEVADAVYAPALVEKTQSGPLSGDLTLRAGQCAVLVQNTKARSIDMQATTLDTLAGSTRCHDNELDDFATPGYDKYADEDLCLEVASALSAATPDSNGHVQVVGIGGTTIAAVPVTFTDETGARKTVTAVNIVFPKLPTLQPTPNGTICG